MNNSALKQLLAEKATMHVALEEIERLTILKKKAKVERRVRKRIRLLHKIAKAAKDGRLWFEA